MPLLSRVFHFWKNVFCRRQVEQDLEDELQAYVEEVTERKVCDGMSVDAARAAAIQELGGLGGLKQNIRSQHAGIPDLRSAAVVAGIAIVFFAAGVASTIVVTRWTEHVAQSNHELVGKAVLNTPPDSTAGLYTGEALKNLVDWGGTNAEIRKRPRVEGTVSQIGTRNPLANVEVYLRSVPQLPFFTTTDEQGRFSFSHPPYGNYVLVVGSNDAQIPLSTSSGAHKLSVPADATYSIGVTTNDGKPVKDYRLDFVMNGIVTVNKPARPPKLNQQLRVLLFTEGKIDVGIPTPSGRRQ